MKQQALRRWNFVVAAAIVAVALLAVQSNVRAAGHRRQQRLQPQGNPIACCLNTADQQGCDELLPADCTAAGGVDAGTGTCEPDPCPGGQTDNESGAPPPGAIACCLNTADQQGCDELLPADCTAAGGVDAGTGTCEPDPCPGGQDANDGGTTPALRRHHRIR